MEISATRPDRKSVERNRRIRMKILYSRLYALTPVPQATRGKRRSLPLPDRLDETVNYIQGLQENIKRMEEKKRQLLGARASTIAEAESGSPSMSRLPRIAVQDLAGVILQVIINSGPDDFFVFNEAIRVIENQGVEIANANFSVVGDRAFHLIHLMVGEPKRGHEASTLLEKLKKDILFLF